MSTVVDLARPTARTPFHVRQGDVLLVAIDAIPDEAAPLPRDRGRVVLALGEATGHAHVIRSPDATLLALDELRFVRTTGLAVIDHEEHAAIEIPPGDYQVVIQREYAPAPERLAAPWRQVAD